MRSMDYDIHRNRTKSTWRAQELCEVDVVVRRLGFPAVLADKFLGVFVNVKHHERRRKTESSEGQ